jgi:16S rRNA C1402 (ribose-2'-O) methylase RsmI
MLGTAATLLATALGTPDALTVTVKEIQDIAVVYTERAQRNRALTGDYFAQDPLMVADAAVCREFVEALRPPANQ